MARLKKISADKEMLKLRKITEALPETKKELAEGLIADASFMATQLDTLRNEIASSGVVEEYKHGQNQYGFKETVAVGVYLKCRRTTLRLSSCSVTWYLPMQALSRDRSCLTSLQNNELG